MRLLAIFAVAGVAASWFLRKPQREVQQGTDAEDVYEEFPDMARPQNNEVPGVDPLPPREPM